MIKIEKYTITQISGILETKEPTLRKYEKDYNLKISRDELGHRYYTEKELEIFRQIIYLKKQGMNIHGIQNILNKSLDVAEQKEQVMELMTVDKVTITELKDILTKYMLQTLLDREEKLVQEFKEELQDVKEKILNQVQSENQKLILYIEEMRKKQQEETLLFKLKKLFLRSR